MGEEGGNVWMRLRSVHSPEADARLLRERGGSGNVGGVSSWVEA